MSEEDEPLEEATPSSLIGKRAGSVLIVCTANRYRSPLGEALLRDALAKLDRHDIEVFSAGTDADPDTHIAEAVVSQLEAQGIHPHRTSTRLLTREMIERAGLILTAERAHRARVVRLSPTAHRKTFTLTQASRLVPVARPLPRENGPNVARLTARLAAARGASSQSDSDDIPDPAGKPSAVYAKAVALVTESVTAVATALAQE